MSPESAQAVTLTDTEPVAVYTSVATLVALALAGFGIVVDPSVLVQGGLGVAALVAYIVAAVKARRKVTPVAAPNL